MTAVCMVATMTSTPALSADAAPAPTAPSPAVFVEEMTGQHAVTDTKKDWDIGATDLGVMWEDGEGGILTAFGDTFTTPGKDGAGVDNWRSNVLLRSTDKELADGMSFDWALTGDDGKAKGMIEGKKVDSDEMTVIPTAGIAVGKRQYLDFMSVRHWGDPGQWDTNFAQMAYSDDRGETWKTDDAPRFENPNGKDPLQMKAFAKDGGYVYIFGTPNGRLGDAHLARVKEDELLDKSAWEFYTGSDWVTDYASIAPLIKGPVAELSVRKDPHSGLWQMVYLDGNADLVLRTASEPTGPWQEPQVLATQQDYPGLYGGFIHPWSPKGELYFAMSVWNEYNVALMKVTLDDKGKITRPNLLVDPSFERSDKFDVPGGWSPSNAGGIDTESAWANVGRRQFWVRASGGEHLMTQNVAVTPYTDYRLTGWLTTGDAVGGNAGEGMIGARPTEIGTDVIAEKKFKDLDGYTKFVVEFNSGANRQIQVYAGSTMTGDRWVQGDDFSLVALGEPTQEADPEPATPPATVPSLADWHPAEGSWKLGDNTRIVAPEEFRASADLLSREIGNYRDGAPAQFVTSGKQASDIEVRIDSAKRDELGDEGYSLDVNADGVTIVAATKAGAFYGTRTVSQLLRQGTTLAAGRTVDKPNYPERGLTISAYEVNISDEWIDRMLVEMADLKLNQVLLQIKVKSDKYPKLNTWSYYPKEQVKKFVEKANAMGIEVIPEINAPGHMDVVLENYPDFQLIDDNGKHQPNKLDVCNPDAVKFYLDLMDEYIEVFQPKQWHVGSDEYMLGSDPKNYQRLIKCVRDKFGDEAVTKDAFETINNAVFDFVNTVNKHAKDKGLTLRMWNDGIHGATKVQLDSDIVVEHWIDRGIPAKPILDRGHKIMNASLALYDTRHPNEDISIHPEKLWTSRWHPGVFFGSHGRVEPGHPQLMGVKASMWVDHAQAMTENAQAERIRDGLRFVAQMGWTGNHGGKSWNQFKSDIDAVGRSPQWMNVDDQPLKEGMYRLSLHGEPSKVLGETGADPDVYGTDTWYLTPTPDRYYQLRSSVTGKCLALSKGFETLGVVTEIGAAPNFEPCRSIDDQSANKQKWQIVRDGDGIYRVTNATTNGVLSVTDGDEVRPHRYLGGKEYPEQKLKAGKLAQLPGDMSDDRWSITPVVGLSLQAERTQLWPGQTTKLTVKVVNDGTADVRDATLHAQFPEGWKVSDLPKVPVIPAGESKEFTLTLTNVDAALGTAFLPLVLDSSAGKVSAGVVIESTCGEPKTPKFVSVDTEQLKGEGGGSGPGSTAVDGDPATYWHTEWDTNTPFPHHIIVDTGEVQDLCGLGHLPRAGSKARQAKDFELYVSEDGKSWGEPVLKGTLERIDDWQQLSFDARGRYVKFVGLNAWRDPDQADENNPWMAVAELTVTAKSGDSRPGTSKAPVMEPAIVDATLSEQPDPDPQPDPSDDGKPDGSGEGDADGSDQGPSEKPQPPKRGADRPQPGLPQTGF
ncbi:MAG: DUF4185 domain-containing protein [Propionibacteriaceae bacterium]|nr:DUF4185 domain-containing protein [Propionibacteriaceae bacterium]